MLILCTVTAIVVSISMNQEVTTSSIFLFPKWHNHSGFKIQHKMGLTLTQLGLMAPHNICILVSIGSGNGLAPIRCQAITWTNADIFGNRPFMKKILSNYSESQVFHSRKLIWKIHLHLNIAYHIQGPMGYKWVRSAQHSRVRHPNLHRPSPAADDDDGGCASRAGWCEPHDSPAKPQLSPTVCASIVPELTYQALTLY